MVYTLVRFSSVYIVKPFKLKKILGGMPKISHSSRNVYTKGLIGCITEAVLSREYQLDLDQNSIGTAHNVNVSS